MNEKMKEIGISILFNGAINFKLIEIVAFEDIPWWCYLKYIINTTEVKYRKIFLEYDHIAHTRLLLIKIYILPSLDENLDFILSNLHEISGNFWKNNFTFLKEMEKRISKNIIIFLSNIKMDKINIGFLVHNNIKIAFVCKFNHQVTKCKLHDICLYSNVLDNYVQLTLSPRLFPYMEKTKFINWIKQFKTIDDLLFYILDKDKIARKRYMEFLHKYDLSWKKYKI